MIRFRDSYEADKWEWLFRRLLRMRRCCANGYDNAYSWKSLDDTRIFGMCCPCAEARHAARQARKMLNKLVREQ